MKEASSPCISACREKERLGIQHGLCATCAAELRQQVRDLMGQNDDLVAALWKAVATIRTWHGLGMGASDAQAWALYQASPEMIQIGAALKKAEGR